MIGGNGMVPVMNVLRVGSPGSGMIPVGMPNGPGGGGGVMLMGGVLPPSMPGGVGVLAQSKLNAKAPVWQQKSNRFNALRTAADVDEKNPYNSFIQVRFFFFISQFIIMMYYHPFFFI
jgi:hypothetical protein